jgi:hypothetical protein
MKDSKIGTHPLDATFAALAARAVRSCGGSLSAVNELAARFKLSPAGDFQAL